jgi:hypothetical protein
VAVRTVAASKDGTKRSLGVRPVVFLSQTPEQRQKALEALTVLFKDHLERQCA